MRTLDEQNGIFHGEDTVLAKYGGWLPSSLVRRGFILSQIKIAREYRDKHSDISGRVELKNPAVEAFRADIENDKVMNDLFEKVFSQVSLYQEETNPRVEDFAILLCILNAIFQTGPSYHVVKDPEGKTIATEPVGMPIYVVFDCLPNNSASNDLFRLPRFNAVLKRLLVAWEEYLADPEGNSNAGLHSKEGGWFYDEPWITVPTSIKETYKVPDPSKADYGFQSWDAFFTKEFREGVRPIQDSGDYTVFHSACESTAFHIGYDVKIYDQFWLIGQKYSLYDILNRNEAYSDQFIGGTVYQAFLSIHDYHRWHSPVNGVIEKIERIDGSYCATTPGKGALKADLGLPEESGASSQPFLTITASRALIYIKADDTALGLVCFVGVGMAEVSTCEIFVKEGDRVNIGDQLGMFHFGGSSYALILGPQCRLDKFLEDHVPINSIIGVHRK